MAVDYAALIDAETWAFIERTNAFYPPDTIDYTVEQQRDIYDRMCRAFHAGYPDGVVAETSTIHAVDRDIPIRIYRRGANEPAATVLYFHGGGFIFGGLESHDDVCAEFCGETGFEIVSVDYRLAPEHTHPAAFDDAMSAFGWAIARSARPVVLAGDSAGGNLAAAVAHAVRGQGRPPIAQLLIYPGLGGDMTRGSYVTHADAPMLTTRDLVFYQHVRAGHGDVAGDTSFLPLLDKDYSGLPPTVIITAECDPLSSDGETYRDRILGAGGDAVWREEQGLVHGYLRGRHSVARIAASFGRMVNALQHLAAGSLPDFPVR